MEKGYSCIDFTSAPGYSHVLAAMDKCFIYFFFDLFVVCYGSWFDHVLSWWKHKDDPNVLLLKYEDMKKVRRTQVTFFFSSIFVIVTSGRAGERSKVKRTRKTTAPNRRAEHA